MKSLLESQYVTFRAIRPMNLDGVDYEPGDVLPKRSLKKMRDPEALVRVGRAAAVAKDMDKVARYLRRDVQSEDDFLARLGKGHVHQINLSRPERVEPGTELVADEDGVLRTPDGQAYDGPVTESAGDSEPLITTAVEEDSDDTQSAAVPGGDGEPVSAPVPGQDDGPVPTGEPGEGEGGSAGEEAGEPGADAGREDDAPEADVVPSDAPLSDGYPQPASDAVLAAEEAEVTPGSFDE